MLTTPVKYFFAKTEKKLQVRKYSRNNTKNKKNLNLRIFFIYFGAKIVVTLANWEASNVNLFPTCLSSTKCLSYCKLCATQKHSLCLADILIMVARDKLSSAARRCRLC